MKALLCVLTQFLKMGGLDYTSSQEIMPARLELRGCVTDWASPAEAGPADAMNKDIKKSRKNPFFFIYISKKHLWDLERHSAQPMTIGANIPSEFSFLLFVKLIQTHPERANRERRATVVWTRLRKTCHLQPHPYIYTPQVCEHLWLPLLNYVPAHVLACCIPYCRHYIHHNARKPM